MPCEKHGPMASVTTKTSAFGLGFCLLSPSGHVFHMAWVTMIKSYSINYYPLFRVRSWNNGVHCMSFYILMEGSSVWNLGKDIDTLEKLQEKWSRLCSHPLTLPALADKRSATDLYKVYKYTHDLYKTDPSTFFTHPRWRYTVSRSYSRDIWRMSCAT